MALPLAAARARTPDGVVGVDREIDSEADAGELGFCVKGARIVVVHSQLEHPVVLRQISQDSLE